MVFVRLRSKNKGKWGTEKTFLFILPLLVSHLFSLTKRKVNAIHLNRPNEPLGITKPQSHGYCHLVTKWFFFLLHLLFPALRWQLGDLPSRVLLVASPWLAALVVVLPRPAVSSPLTPHTPSLCLHQSLLRLTHNLLCNS